MENKPVIGILGGIGSGKSTVAHAFAGLGCAVIDADALAHEVLDEPEVISAVRNRFGEAVIDSNGLIDRKAMGRVVFEDEAALAFLNGLIHPQVLAECEALMRGYQRSNVPKAIVLDMPLLLEVGWEKKCDILVFVACERGKRAERMLKKGIFDENQLRKREKFQISLDKKREIADYIIDNNSENSDVAEQVAQIFSNITKVQ